MLTPKSIKLAAGNNTLSVQWSDGHLSVYPYRYLRDKCPCATCHDMPSKPIAPAGPQVISPLPMLGQKPLRPDRAELVGRYALQIYWNDAHSAGIYSFEYLRDLCPCAECERTRASADIA